RSSETALKQLSSGDPNGVVIRLAEIAALRSMLALYLATDRVSNEVLGAATSNQPDKDIAQQARQIDLISHREEVRRLLRQAVRGAVLFFRGTAYQPIPGESPGGTIRATLGEILPQIYTRYAEVPYRIVNEENAVKAALAGNTSNSDLQALGIY